MYFMYDFIIIIIIIIIIDTWLPQMLIYYKCVIVTKITNIYGLSTGADNGDRE